MTKNVNEEQGNVLAILFSSCAADKPVADSSSSRLEGCSSLLIWSLHLQGACLSRRVLFPSAAHSLPRFTMSDWNLETLSVLHLSEKYIKNVTIFSSQMKSTL